MKIFHEDGKSPTLIIVRSYMRVVSDGELAIVTAQSAFAIPKVVWIVIVVYIDGGIIRHKDINGVGRDAVVETIRSGQSRMVRDFNFTRGGFIVVILARISIHIDAAATVPSLCVFAGIYLIAVHKPADGELRMIPNVQATAVVDAQAVAARLRIGVRNIHVGALVQNQCAGAKEYRRDIGIFAIGAAGVRSRFDSQLAAFRDGHFAVGRIDAQSVQR